jgi:hypothetical protein
MAKAITSDKLVLGTAADPIRFSFLEIAKPKPFKAGDPASKPKWQGTALLDPKNASHKAQLQAVNEAVKKMLALKGWDTEDVSNYWKTGLSDVVKSYCFGKGDRRKKDGKVYDGYAGMIYLQASANEEDPPIIGDRTGKLVLPKEKGFPYAGAYGIMKVSLWLQDNDWGKRVNANFLTIQFIKPGEAFSGSAQLNPDEEFERLPDDVPAGVSAGSDDDFMN